MQNLSPNVCLIFFKVDEKFKTVQTPYNTLAKITLQFSGHLKILVFESFLD
jgi:hypothetical protein